MPLNPRTAKLLDELPKHNWKVEPAALAAGFSKSYARKQQKQILQHALKAQAQQALELAANNNYVPSKELKQSLAELIGMSRQDVYKRLKDISSQDKDLSSALKVLIPLARDLGIPLTDDQPKTIVPILNIGIRENLPSLTGERSELLINPVPPREE